MRRSDPESLSLDDLLPARVRHAETHDPDHVISVLEPLVQERRQARMKQVFGARLESVVVVFDDPVDPHNGAAVLRSSEAFGVQRIHVIERGNPFLVSSTVSRGSEKWLDVYKHSRTETCVAALKAQGYLMAGAHPEGTLLPSDLRNIPRVAIVLGNEHRGIHPDLEAQCDLRVKVPMRGFVESLNVSVTAAVLLSSATAGRPGDLSEMDKKRLYARGLYFSVPHAESHFRT